ncbi:MAG: hypothetical protein HGB10_09600 [Coriobacteriia bacterium]|nr:hypothetical protein [Coriobacteriia bacterium]
MGLGRARRAWFAPAIALIALLAGVAVGCSPATTANQPAILLAPVTPAPADMSTPLSAVESYLAWTSYAYAMMNSDVATHTMGPEEEVRVNSYVQLNKEKGQRLHQVLVEFKPGSPSKDGSITLLPAAEKWEYRYLSTDGQSAVSETLTAAYEATYTLIPGRAKTYLVGSVTVQALSEVK